MLARTLDRRDDRRARATGIDMRKGNAIADTECLGDHHDRIPGLVLDMLQEVAVGNCDSETADPLIEHRRDRCRLPLAAEFVR